jgi:hypothetical protein
MSSEVEMPLTLGSTSARRLLLFMIAMALSACAAASSPTRIARSSKVVTPEEISISEATSVHDLLRRRRPMMLLARAPRTGGHLTEVTPTVYVDGIRSGGIDVLNFIPASTVLRIEFLTELEADMRFHGQHPGGVIALSIRSARRR